jgi:hypothetical protein
MSLRTNSQIQVTNNIHNEKILTDMTKLKVWNIHALRSAKVDTPKSLTESALDQI